MLLLTAAELSRHLSCQSLEELHESAEHAAAYLQSDMFKGDVVTGLSPYFQAAPEIRIFTVAG